MGELVKYDRDGRVAYIGLNRPERMNAINGYLMADLMSALDQLIADDEARVGIIYGEGRAFSAGADLTPGQARAANSADDMMHLRARAYQWLRVWDCPKPLIAQVHGYCIAGGTQLPAMCDIVAVGEGAVIGWPKVPVGGGWISPMWAHRIGAQRAKLMSFRVGSTMTAREAYEWGYASLIFPDGELAKETRKVADDIAKLPSDMLAIKKFANNRVAERAGFRETIMAVDWDAFAHDTTTVATARAWIKEMGLKGAISRFAAEGM